jgi:hypothetical protein
MPLMNNIRQVVENKIEGSKTSYLVMYEKIETVRVVE